MTIGMSAEITLCSHMGSYIRKSLPTRHILAFVWFLASMSSNVNSKGAPLNEALAASWDLTRVWSLVDVDAIMSLQVRPSAEALIIILAGSPILYQCLRTLSHACQLHR